MLRLRMLRVCVVSSRIVARVMRRAKSRMALQALREGPKDLLGSNTRFERLFILNWRIALTEEQSAHVM